MIITTKGKNALKIMLVLAMHPKGEYIRLKDIAEKEEISEKYLEHIASSLQKARIVKSARGVNGGYCLSKSADSYTVGEIIKCLEGDLYPTDCTHKDETPCPRKDRCFCYPLWDKLDKAVNDVLDNTTLQDIIDWKKQEKVNHYKI